jgi:hypothetical protein
LAIEIGLLEEMGGGGEREVEGNRADVGRGSGGIAIFSRCSCLD